MSAGTHPQPDIILASNPGAGYRHRKAEIDEAIQRVLDSGWYILGREVEAFEREFAAYLGTKHAVGVANGTDGLVLALRACEIGPGDAVITVSHTAVATIAAIEQSGAMPILVDITPSTYTMDPHSLEQALRLSADGMKPGYRVKAVIPVHLYGQSVDMRSIMSIAQRHKLRVIEDCSQAHGAVTDGRKVGTLGDIGVFSLYPTKNLGALGDGGVVCTANPRLEERLRLLREYGWRKRNRSEMPGFNSRLHELQAAVLRVRLGYLDEDNAARQAIAREYDQAFAGSPVMVPHPEGESQHVYHQYVVSIPGRDRVKLRLAENNIQTHIHYPEAVHQQPAYANRLPRLVSLAKTDAAVREILSLPMYPQLPLESARRTAECVLHFLREGA